MPDTVLDTEDQNFLALEAQRIMKENVNKHYSM